MQNSMVVFTSFVSYRRYSRANLVEKLKIVNLRQNLVLTLIRISRMQWWCSLLFWPETPTLSKFDTKNRTCQFVLKLGCSNIQNSMVITIFTIFNQKYPFWVNLVQNIKTVIFWWNLVAKLIRLCKIQWWCSLFQSMTGNTLLFVTGNTFFRQIWSSTFKIVRLSWNLVLRLIQVCKTQWLCLLYFCLQPEILFLGKFSSKNQNCQSKMKFGNQTTLSMQNLMVIIIFSAFDRKYLFGAIRSKKLKLSF